MYKLFLLFMAMKLTSGFHVAARQFTKRSQMTRKCVKNKELVHEVFHNHNDY